MFYVYLLNSSTKKARSKYETNKKKTSYDFSVSLYIKYLVPRFYTDILNMYLETEIWLSVIFNLNFYLNYLIKNNNSLKKLIYLIVLIEIYRGYTLSRFAIMILSSMLKVPSVYKKYSLCCLWYHVHWFCHEKRDWTKSWPNT